MNTKIKGRFNTVLVVIIIFGIISLLGDMVYESARSANSQYFNLLSISAAKVGLVFGIGEFLGYFLRLLAGIASDKSGKYWLFMFIGYGILAIVPLIGLTTHWNVLVMLLLMERIGKALRNPAKDTILSEVAAQEADIGFAFGLQEALDQIGAFTGPLIFTSIFYFTGKSDIAQYQLAYKTLIIPFILLMFFLVYAYRRITLAKLIPAFTAKEFRSEPLKPLFWTYTVFTFFCTLGFVSFSLIGYHLKARSLMSDAEITLLYSISMIADAAAALFAGKFYDRLKTKTGLKTGGLLVLVALPFFTAALPFFILTHSKTIIFIGMIVFGIIMGTHETVMRSAIADITPFYKRGAGYGIFNGSYGLALFSGAALMGLFYDKNEINWIIGFVCIAEFIAFLLYLRMNQMLRLRHYQK